MGFSLQLVSDHSRLCGQCTACCTALGVVELGKPLWERCQHLCGGCGIYQDRPATCKEFTCLWLRGRLAEEHRPDKVGLIFQGEDDTLDSQVACWEVVPGAVNANLPLLKELAVSRVILIFPYDQKTKRRFLAPPHIVEAGLIIREAGQ